jgi:hypothetical protein
MECLLAKQVIFEWTSSGYRQSAVNGGKRKSDHSSGKAFEWSLEC